MKKYIKKIADIFRLRELYFSLSRFLRNLIEHNSSIHSVASKASFNIRNKLGLSIHHVPYLLAKRINSDSIIVDCGANVGAIVKPLLKHGGTYYCFEPNPIAFEGLSSNIGSSKNIHLINKAVGIEKRMAKLFKHVSSKGAIDNERIHSVSASLLSNKPNIDNDNYYEVEVIDFIDFLKNLDQRIYIMKIDIEGAEVELVNAILDHGLNSQIDYLFVETHENTISELRRPTFDLIHRTKDLGIKNIYYNWT